MQAFDWSVFCDGGGRADDRRVGCWFAYPQSHEQYHLILFVMNLGYHPNYNPWEIARTDIVCLILFVRTSAELAETFANDTVGICDKIRVFPSFSNRLRCVVVSP
jgi:hypothetical protein